MLLFDKLILMKIYLDIDGTMIHDDLSDMYCKPAAGLEDFIVALRPYETYWLTTHCTTGDPTNARRIMKAVLPEELRADIDRIKPTVWQDLKTNGIDFGSDFIWFDNDVYASAEGAPRRKRPDSSCLAVFNEWLLPLQCCDDVFFGTTNLLARIE